MTRLALVGATGNVGRVMLEVLREREFPADELVLFASRRSAGMTIDGREVRVLDDDADLSGIDLALFSAGASTAREWAPRFVDAGAVVVDNSSAFRRDPEIPLVVSEVNPHALHHHHGIIANPNCSTMQLMVALAPIHREAGIERLIVSTYQSVSGTGKAALDELDAQVRASVAGEPLPAPSVYPDHIAFNVIGAAGNFAPGDDHTDEERKMMFETRKILEDEQIGVAVTCVRVPVRISHSESVNLQTRERALAGGGCRPRRGVRRAHPSRRVPSAGAQHVRRRRQPAQGRRDQRGADRRAAGRRPGCGLTPRGRSAPDAPAREGHQLAGAHAARGVDQRLGPADGAPAHREGDVEGVDGSPAGGRAARPVAQDGVKAAVRLADDSERPSVQQPRELTPGTSAAVADLERLHPGPPAVDVDVGGPAQPHRDPVLADHSVCGGPADRRRPARGGADPRRQAHTRREDG
jgi:aspartate-semialdehyde dehydrogenase